ncbi:MAG: hypothetical protein Q4E89_11775, partial [Eubacteriales bacterium]|nr:hypothetical protein [Eubacteriales bacterium]
NGTLRGVEGEGKISPIRLPLCKQEILYKITKNSFRSYRLFFMKFKIIKKNTYEKPKKML